MPAREQRHDEFFDDALLTDDDFGQFGGDSLIGLPELFDGGGIGRVDLAGWSFVGWSLVLRHALVSLISRERRSGEHVGMG
jgi:hypothetical protein